MPALRQKLLLASGSTLVGLLLAQWIWTNRPVPETVELVDNREQVAAILEERAVDEEQKAASEGKRPTKIVPSIEDELVREALSEETAISMFSSLRGGGRKHIVYDPITYYWEVGDIRRTKRFPEHPLGEWEVRTNALGFRKSAELRAEKPDLRILVTGDSHTAGIVPNEEMFANLLEARMNAANPERVVEGLNGGKGGYSFYNYLGVLEKHLDLEPDVFVVAAFGGNDFIGCVGTFRYFNRLRHSEPRREIIEDVWRKERKNHQALVSQDLNQIVSFAARPDDVEVAEVAICQILTKILEICQAEGIRLMYVYIPPCTDVQRHLVEGHIARMAEKLDLTPEELEVTNTIADHVLAFLGEKGVTSLDMRPVFRASEKPCYWMEDLHINTEGHRLIADALFEELTKSGQD